MSEENKPPYGIADAIRNAVFEVFAESPCVSCWIEYDGQGSDAIPQAIKVRLGDFEPLVMPYSHESYVTMSAIVARASRRLS